MEILSTEFIQEQLEKFDKLLDNDLVREALEDDDDEKTFHRTTDKG